MVKRTQSIRVLIACGEEAAATRLSVPTLCAAQAEAIASFLSSDQQEAPAVLLLMLFTVIMLFQAMASNTVHRRAY